MMRAAQLVSYEKDFQTNQVDDPTVTDPLDVIVRVGAAGFCRRRAQYLSENSDYPIERIAGQTGFGSPRRSASAPSGSPERRRTPDAHRSGAAETGPG